jgi:hypothetical protein
MESFKKIFKTKATGKNNSSVAQEKVKLDIRFAFRSSSSSLFSGS